MSREIWTVGAAFRNATIDKSNEFFINSLWYDGYARESDFRNLKHLNEVKANDIFLLKSKAIKNKTIPFTRLKAIGFVIDRVSISDFSVKWIKGTKFPIDFDGVLYMKTIEKLREDKLRVYVLNFLKQVEKNKLHTTLGFVQVGQKE